jgi:hypothetical protein
MQKLIHAFNIPWLLHYILGIRYYVEQIWLSSISALRREYIDSAKGSLPVALLYNLLCLKFVLVKLLFHILWAWNKKIMCLYIDVIVDDDFQLKVVERNEKTTNGYQPNVAEFDLVMQVWIFFVNVCSVFH